MSPRSPVRPSPGPPRDASTPPSPGPRELLAAVPDAVFCCDADGALLWVTPAAEALMVRPATDLIGQPFHELLAPARRAHARRVFALQWARGPEILEHDITLACGDGSEAPVRVRVRRLAGDGGAPWFVGVARADTPSEEIDQLRRYAAELATEAKAARAAAELKSEFLTMMSNEFRTPLDGVIGMSHHLLQCDLGAEERGLVEVIQKSSQALTRLINDTLDFSSLEAGTLQIETLDFDLRSTVEQIVALLTPLANDKGIQFECQIRHEVPSLLRGDPGRIRQVLLNLASNAIKLTEKGAVTLQIERLEESDRGVALRFSVSDTGIGAQPEQQALLFQSFTQADVTLARRFGATGLGLAISRRLVGLMHGAVGVDSAPDRGSTFWFQLPLEKQPPVPVAAPTPEREPELRKVRVLVVDSSSAARQSMLKQLVGWGCSATGASDGAEALGLMREAVERKVPYRVAIVDAELSGESGEELAKAVRANTAFAGTLLALVTHIGRPGDAARALELGFSAYLMKPVEATELHEALLEVLRRADEPVARRSLVTRHSLADARRGRVRILLVEDEPISQRVAQSALTRMGYAVELAPTAREALEALDRSHFDLVLLDIQLPDQDGEQVAAEIRARDVGRGARIPVVAVTGNMDQVDRERCLAAGMDDYLTKPFDLGQLCAVVELWTRGGAESATESAPAAKAGTAPAAAKTPAARPQAPAAPAAAPAPARAPAAAPAAPTAAKTPASRPQAPAAPAAAPAPARAPGATPAPSPAATPAAARTSAARPQKAATPAEPTPADAPASGSGEEPESNEPPLDLERLDRSSMGIAALRESLLLTFLAEVEPRFERVGDAVAMGDARRVEFEAHALKGMCATIGAITASNAFAAIEQAGREEHLGEAFKLLKRAEREVRRAENYAARFEKIVRKAA